MPLANLIIIPHSLNNCNSDVCCFKAVKPLLVCADSVCVSIKHWGLIYKFIGNLFNMANCIDDSITPLLQSRYSNSFLVLLQSVDYSPYGLYYSTVLVIDWVYRREGFEILFSKQYSKNCIYSNNIQNCLVHRMSACADSINFDKWGKFYF